MRMVERGREGGEVGGAVRVRVRVGVGVGTFDTVAYALVDVTTSMTEYDDGAVGDVVVDNDRAVEVNDDTAVSLDQ